MHLIKNAVSGICESLLLLIEKFTLDQFWPQHLVISVYIKLSNIFANRTGLEIVTENYDSLCNSILVCS